MTYTRPYFSLMCMAIGKSSADLGGKNHSACFFRGAVPAERGNPQGRVQALSDGITQSHSYTWVPCRLHGMRASS